jgi:hypothetical protein
MTTSMTTPERQQQRYTRKRPRCAVRASVRAVGREESSPGPGRADEVYRIAAAAALGGALGTVAAPLQASTVIAVISVDALVLTLAPHCGAAIDRPRPGDCPTYRGIGRVILRGQSLS